MLTDGLGVRVLVWVWIKRTRGTVAGGLVTLVK
jgi:hypothetical protein